MERAATLLELVQRALYEDRADNDRTGLAVIPPNAQARARIVAKEAGILSGGEVAALCFTTVDPDSSVELLASAGQRIQAGAPVLQVEGSARSLLAAERTALNLLCHLSGVATAAAALVDACGPVSVLDTRKTLPGLRDLEKQAVLDGGGHNHRRDLDDQLLLKENHFSLSGKSYGETVAIARAAEPDRILGAEACSVEQAREALQAGADYVLLDNFVPDELIQAAATLRSEFADREIVLEGSGGIRLEGSDWVASSGLDRVSVGRLTHSASAMDFTLLLDPV